MIFYSGTSSNTQAFLQIEKLIQQKIENRISVILFIYADRNKFVQWENAYNNYSCMKELWRWKVEVAS
jgi:hypothetical protein